MTLTDIPWWVWMLLGGWVVGGGALSVVAQSLANVHEWLGKRARHLPPVSPGAVLVALVIGCVLGPLFPAIAIHGRIGAFQRLRE